MLKHPPLPLLRPTTDRAKEMLFNVLVHTCLKVVGDQPLSGLRFLDGFAGMGTIGLEALSRGASHVTFIEQEKRLCDGIQATVQAWGQVDHVAVYSCPLGAVPTTDAPADIVFLDPPYDQGADAHHHVKTLLQKGWVTPNTWIVLECALDTPKPCLETSLFFTKRAGNSAFHFCKLP